MPVAATVDAPIIAADYDSVCPFGHKEYEVIQTNRFSIASVRVSDYITYPMKSPAHSSYVRATGDLWVDGLQRVAVGNGDSIEAALHDFGLRIHDAIQSLMYKRSFEMTVDERLEWRAICDVVDIAVFRNTMPLRVRQIGIVSKMTPRAGRITWEDGTFDRIAVDDVPILDFVTYKAGQPVEAIVERDPLTFALRRIVYISRCSPRKRLPRGEELELLRKHGWKPFAVDREWSP